MTTRESGSGRRGHTAGAFDIRLIIAMLFAIYGVVVTVMGLVGTSEQEIAQSAGVNINLWSGLGMLVFAILFAVWARVRPIIVPDEPESDGSGDR